MGDFIYRLAANDEEAAGGFEVRRRVFIEEQGIAEGLVFDERDAEALHVVVKDRDSVVATARVRFPAPKRAKLERMAVLRPFRGRGIGKGIISFLDGELGDSHAEEVVLHSQYDAVEFYKSCGFEQMGDPFWEAGVKHLRMERRL
jgi:predicted GNAT family N-acyltransferase